MFLQFLGLLVVVLVAVAGMAFLFNNVSIKTKKD